MGAAGAGSAKLRQGTVQNVYPLDRFAANKEPGFGQLTITTGKFYRITGESTQHRGVEPDIVLPSAISTEDIGESALDSALPWDRIRPANFKRSNDFKPILDTLANSHKQRVPNDPNYQYLLQNIGAYDELRKEKSISSI
jgi:carboxyl-terminal processing protease